MLADVTNRALVGTTRGGYDGDALPGTGPGTGIFTADRTFTGMTTTATPVLWATSPGGTIHE
jgi:hypothetical protein